MYGSQQCCSRGSQIVWVEVLLYPFLVSCNGYGHVGLGAVVYVVQAGYQEACLAGRSAVVVVVVLVVPWSASWLSVGKCIVGIGAMLIGPLGSLWALGGVDV